MGQKSIFLNLLETTFDRDSFISTVDGIEGLQIHDLNESIEDFLQNDFNQPSIIVCSYEGLSCISKSATISSLITRGCQFVIVSDHDGDIDRFITGASNSFSFIQPPLDRWKLRPLLLNAYKKVQGIEDQKQNFENIDDEILVSMIDDFYNHISDPIVWVDVDSLMILNSNDAAKDVLGQGLSLRGENLLKYSHQPENTLSALQRKVTYSADRILKDREGKLIMASVHTSYYRTSNHYGALIIIKNLASEIDCNIEIVKRDKFFKNVLDSIATPILQVSSKDFKIIFINEITTEKLGFSKECMIGSTIDSFSIEGENLHNLLEREESFFTQWRILNAWGNIRLMEVHAQFIGDGFSRFIINLQDITERQALLENQEYTLQRLTEAHRMAKIGGWTYKSGDSNPFFSPELLELHDLDPKEPLDRQGYLNLIHWKDREEIDNWMKEMISGKKNYPIRYFIKLKDGGIRFFLLRCERILDENNKIIGLNGTSQDISEVELLEQKNSLYTQIFDTMEAEMILLSDRGIIIECNQAAAEKLGYLKENLRGKFLSVLNSRYTKKSWPRFWKRINDQGAELREARHRRKDGTEYDALISISLVDYMGKKMGLALINDISNIKNYQKELQNNLQEKTAILQEVHHRMGNNLQTIASFISLKSMNSEDPQTQLQLGEVKDRIMGIAAIHNSMYAQGRFLDLDLLKHLQTVWKKPRIEAEFGPDIQIDGDLIMIDINRALPLSLVVSELFSNTFRHAFDIPGGSISLHIHNREDEIRLHYHDSGRGYPDSNEIKGKETVGLTLVRNLVERQLKGTIRFYNDCGAHAEIILPKEFFNRSISDPLQRSRDVV